MNSVKKIDQIPVEVRDYFTAGDKIGQIEVHRRYPNLEQTLRAPSTRAALVDYLGSNEPFHDPPGLTVGALPFLQGNASAKEAAILRPLMKHPDGWVRVRMCEYLMALYYPPRDQPAMTGLFHEMLADPDEVVRVQAARWIKGLNLAGAMQKELQQWMVLAPERKFDRGESFEIIKTMTR